MFDDVIEVDGGSKKKVKKTAFWFESTFLLREDLYSICEIWKQLDMRFLCALVKIYP
ncbi:unnamed protein product [Brassica oleracea]